MKMMIIWLAALCETSAMAAPPPPQPAEQAAQQPDWDKIIENQDARLNKELAKLADQRAKGLISQSTYKAAKARLLGR